jgi:hypothetical protein
MQTIPELLDLAKKRKGLSSDRALAKALELTAVHHYRTKGVIPDDETAIRLAELCGLPAEQVLITCHLLKAPSGEVMDVWRSVFKKAVNLAIVLAALVSVAPCPADAGENYRSPGKFSLYPLCDVVLYVAGAGDSLSCWRATNLARK